MNICHDISLLQYNTFGIDVHANTLISYESNEELVDIVLNHLPNLPKPLLHIGGGSNLLFMNDFKGTILLSEIKIVEVVSETEDSIIIRAGSGLVLDEFISYTLSQGWYGLENLSLIPGQVGASAVQNVGAYGVEAGDRIVAVNCISLLDGSEKRFSHDECNYSYRHSIFKESHLYGKYAVVSVEYALSKTFIPQLNYGGIMHFLTSFGFTLEGVSAIQLRDIIISIRREKLPDPKVIGNAGSFFMNPIVDISLLEKIRTQYPEVPHYPTSHGKVKIPAAWLIDKCGWKGKSLGNASVHSRQPLVLINNGYATGNDIKSLSDRIQQDVFDKFSISICPEVNFIY
jgi:UDP-N-acetylmuramate dehydrogenase